MAYIEGAYIQGATEGYQPSLLPKYDDTTSTQQAITTYT